ncbi:MAG: carbohydrate kinase [Bacteroidetes bacterium]|nr:carbohydrate kinase [Bacteroidota bacterium]
MEKVFSQLNSLHVVVIGDVMLDNYWWGDVDRISPEAPVPIVAIRKQESRLGGAANVALNCKALGAKVTMASIVGNDKNGVILRQLCEDADILTQLLSCSDQRITTTKTRVISRNQQMLRIDDEITNELTLKEEHGLIDNVLRYLQIEKPDLVIFEDYNKGVLKENVIKHIIAHCRELNIVTAVDPKKENFLSYQGVSIFKPNLKEVKEGLHMEIPEITVAHLSEVHAKLQQILHHDITFITLSEHGVFFQSNSTTSIIPSHLRNIADVSGAGDTVIATAALIFTATKNPYLMAEVSNLAGGLVCEQVGVVSIDKLRLLEECKALLNS